MSPTTSDGFDLKPFQDPLTIQRVLNQAKTVAIVGLTYHLAEGRVVLRDYLGDIGQG